MRNHSFHYKYRKKRKLDPLFNLLRELAKLYKKRSRSHVSYNLGRGGVGKFSRRSKFLHARKIPLFFKNLFFSKKSYLRSRFFWTGVVFLVIISGLIYFVFFSDFFKLKEVEIVGLEKIKEEDIRSNISATLEDQLFLTKENFIFIKTSKIQENLFKNFSSIASASVNKKFPDKLKIEIKEREAIGIYCNIKYQISNIKNLDEEVMSGSDNIPGDIESEKEIIETCFYIDENGVIFDEAPQASGSLILVIKDLREKNPYLGEKVMNPDFLNFIQNIKEKVAQIPKFITLKEFLINKTGELEIVTTEGWKIFFNPTHNSPDDIYILKEVLEKEIGSARANLEYIDLRIPGRVYYK